MTIRLSCASCPWTWNGTNIIKAEAAAEKHTAENNHCVMSDIEED